MNFSYDSLFYILSSIDETERLTLRLVSKLFNDVIISIFPKKQIAELIKQKKYIPAMYYLQNTNLYPEYYKLNDVFQASWHNFKFLDYMVKFNYLNIRNVLNQIYKVDLDKKSISCRNKFDDLLVILMQHDNSSYEEQPDYKFLIKNGLNKAFTRLIQNPNFIMLDESIESLVVYAIENIKYAGIRNKIIDTIIKCSKEYDYGGICIDTLNKLIEIDIDIANKVLWTYDEDLIYDILCRDDEADPDGRLYFSTKKIRDKYELNAIKIKKRIARIYDLSELRDFDRIHLPDEFNNCPLTVDTSSEDNWFYECEVKYCKPRYDYTHGVYRDSDQIDYITVTELYPV